MAQEVVYNIPKSIRTDQAFISFKKVKASSSKYYVNYKAENIGNGVLVIDRSKTGLVQNEGEMHPISGKYVLKPGEKKTIYNEFRVKPPVEPKADQLDLTLHGIRYATGSGATLEADKLMLASGATQTIGDFSIKLMEYKVYDDRVFAEVKCTYKGGQHRVGKIDLEKLSVEGGEAEIVRKGDVVFSGKSYTFAINITPGGPEYSLNWTGVLEVMNLVDVNIDAINIKSSTFKESEEEPEEESTENSTITVATTSTSEPCALSYNEFSTLRKDLKSEVNSGGKPIAMANEYLSGKGCLNTAQVVEFMGQFNLDKPRLEFAKMAYQFTSDKHKYHLAVGKLSYNKNKEALEEFLGAQ